MLQVGGWSTLGSERSRLMMIYDDDDRIGETGIAGSPHGRFGKARAGTAGNLSTQVDGMRSIR
jgi:hypothetical protein